MNIKWTFASLLTVYSSSIWPLQCQCLLFIKSGRFMQPEEVHDLILYFSFDENNPPNWKKECVMLGWSKSRWIWIQSQYAKYRDIWYNYHLWYFKIVSIVSQFWNMTRAIYAKYHHKSCCYLCFYSCFSISGGYNTTKRTEELTSTTYRLGKLLIKEECSATLLVYLVFFWKFFLFIMRHFQSKRKFPFTGFPY